MDLTAGMGNEEKRKFLTLEHLNFHDFVGLLFVACIILLYNHICMEFRKPCANPEPMCALENVQLRGKLFLRALQFQ
jgi:hypothetical protein